MVTSTCKADSVFARGFRDGFRGIFAIGRYDAAPIAMRRHVGSPETDRIARYRDMEAFKADVDHGRLDVIYE